MPTSREEEQAVRKEVLRNDQLVREKAAGHGTYFSHACAEADAIGGRFSAVGKASVTGSSPTQTILPAPSWAGQDVGVEPPFGVDIDWVEAVGSEKEIEEAARILREGQVAACTSQEAADRSGTSAAPTATPSPADVQTDVPLLQSKSSAISLASAVGPASRSAPTDELAGPLSSQTTGSAATTPVTRGPAVNEQRFVAGPHSFRRL
jgi:hypothetical protein